MKRLLFLLLLLLYIPSARAANTYYVSFSTGADGSSTAQTFTTSAATCTTLGSASVTSSIVPFTAKTGTAITYFTTGSSTPLYQARVNIFQEGVN